MSIFSEIAICQWHLFNLTIHHFEKRIFVNMIIPYVGISHSVIVNVLQ